MERQNWLGFIDQTYGCMADDPLESLVRFVLIDIDAPI
jgi:hypothetical protein